MKSPVFGKLVCFFFFLKYKENSYLQSVYDILINLLGLPLGSFSDFFFHACMWLVKKGKKSYGRGGSTKIELTPQEAITTNNLKYIHISGIDMVYQFGTASIDWLLYRVKCNKFTPIVGLCPGMSFV